MRGGRGCIDRGKTFDRFLEQDGLLADTEEWARKNIITDQVITRMTEERPTKTAMAARMHTSRRQLDRLLDPSNPSVT